MVSVLGARAGPLGPGAAGPGGWLALRSHGRAVENWPSTTASRAAGARAVRTIAPAPGGARRWVTSSDPGGREDLEPPGAQAVAQRHSVPVSPGGTE